ncbi:hypothetical protein [Pseudonocardia sp. N23]|uniref:hypothetical protein n=1 Tax=Pseudonocardia sp. N23 TaxID=1987376 RepID=UPI000BFB1CA7|nr:hypothetical protein [Pseudonocardia sp. N23]GAY07785.1 hypothetical protein TOK_4062 [Pseudonocardia sp. N23]
MSYAQVPGHRSTMYRATFLARPFERFADRPNAATAAMITRSDASMCEDDAQGARQGRRAP